MKKLDPLMSLFTSVRATVEEPMSKHTKILVTGAKGFLGKKVCRELRDSGYENICELEGSKVCDLRNTHEAQSILLIEQPDIIIHLAARVGGIGENQKYPGAFFYDNMAMGMNLIEASRKLGIEKFILVSTVCAYPKHTRVPFNEEDLWNGYPEETNAPYGIAKKALTEMMNAYRKQYDFNGITLIPVNMYGPDFGEDTHVIPDLIRKFDHAYRTGDPVEVWGDGSPTREFLYVDDCARAIVLAMEKYNKPDPVNIGTGHEISIKEVVGFLHRHYADHNNLIDVVWDDSKPNGQPRRCLDINKAWEEFGFLACMPFQEGLGRTIGSYYG